MRKAKGPKKKDMLLEEDQMYIVLLEAHEFYPASTPLKVDRKMGLEMIEKGKATKQARSKSDTQETLNKLKEQEKE